MSKPRQTDYGKGDSSRIENKKEFDRNWVLAFGKECPKCKGDGSYLPNPEFDNDLDREICPMCHGLGKVEK